MLATGVVRSNNNRTGDEFRVDTRQSAYNHLDFSIILTFIAAGMEYRLLRCNGVHASKHTNKIEHRIGYPDATIEPTFHVHMATERYQEAGYAIDSYAEPTKEYVDPPWTSLLVWHA